MERGTGMYFEVRTDRASEWIGYEGRGREEARMTARYVNQGVNVSAIYRDGKTGQEACLGD